MPSLPKQKKKKKQKAVEKHLLDLYLLSSAQPAHRKGFLKKASAGLIRAICQCADNVLKGKYTLSLEERTKLARHKKKLRKLAGKGTIHTKRAAVQKGGFAWLLPLLAPVLGTVLGGIFKK